MKVGIIFGSKSDVDVMKGAADCLKKFGIEYSAHVLSAHRVPELLEETLEKFEKEDYGVIIAGAGLAAHLPRSYCFKNCFTCNWCTHKSGSRRFRCTVLNSTNA